MRYLSVEELIAINEAEVGPGAFRDFGLAESAALRPQQSVFGEDAYPDIHAKAAALAHSLTRNHPFVDGNKRTALLAIVLFYRLNGWRWHASQDEAVALILDIAEGTLDEVTDIAARIRRHAHQEASN